MIAILYEIERILIISWYSCKPYIIYTVNYYYICMYTVHHKYKIFVLKKCLTN